MKRYSIYILIVAYLLLFASGACGQPQNGDERSRSIYKGFQVDDKLLADKQLVQLIVNTPSMDDAERQEMFDLLATASRHSWEKLRKILLEEQARQGNSELPASTRNNASVEPEKLLDDLAAVISALGRGREERIAAIRPFLKSNEYEITVAAVEALGALADKGSADQIQVLAVGGVPRVRVAALYALERIDREKLLEVLYRSCHDDNSLVSIAAESISQQLAKEFTRDDLLGLTNSRDVPTGQWALSTLQEYHTLQPGDISLLATFLEGAPPELQQDIVLTLLHSNTRVWSFTYRQKPSTCMRKTSKNTKKN